MTKNKPAPGTVFPRRLSFHPESRTVGLPLAGLAGRPLRELEMAAAGIDYLIHSFHAGTPSSPTHLVWFVAKGRIKCDYGVGPRVVRAGEMVICPAHSPHWIELASPKARGYWFHLRDVPRWQHLRAQGPLVRTSMEIESLKFLVERCYAESMVGRIDSYPLALHYAELIALVFLRELSVPLDETRGAMRRRLGQLWDAVDADLKKPWSVGRLAAMAHVSTSYLHKLTARHYGARPMEMVLRLRMQQAEALLIHTDLAQEDIAQEIGYGTAYSFSHAFLRHAGVRPGTFRLRFLESRN